MARSRVSNGTDTYYVASFATFTGGLVSDLVEVWTEGVTGPGGSGT